MAVPGGGGSEPTPSGTILFDTRAGGAQDIQSVSTIAAAALFFTATGGEFSYGLSSDPEYMDFTTDVDGAGTHALRMNWKQRLGGESAMNSLYFLHAATSEIYTQVKIRMGRTATGGGIGSVDAFAPVTVDGGMKRIMWYRDEGGGGLHDQRVYWAMQTGDPANREQTLSIDGNNFNETFHDDYGIASTVRWTFYLKAASTLTALDGVLKVWRNGVLAASNTAVSGGHSPYNGVTFDGIGNAQFHHQNIITTFNKPSIDMTEYWWDYVTWKP